MYVHLYMYIYIYIQDSTGRYTIDEQAPQFTQSRVKYHKRWGIEEQKGHTL